LRSSWEADPTIGEHSTHDLLQIAGRATQLASQFIRSHRPAELTVKGDRDLSSDVDMGVERLVRTFLRDATPEIGFLGEEGGGNTKERDLWVLDPIDGTINFLHGVPLFAVSLALIHAESTLAAVVELPLIGTAYTALRGHGSFADGRRIRVSATSTLKDSLISIDQYTFGSDAERKNRARLRLTEQLSKRVQRLRILGASSVDLAWTAEGRLDACIMLGNNLWDTAAGVLIAREAGAHVLAEDGRDHSRQSWATIAVTASIEAELMTVIQSTLSRLPAE